MIMLNRAGRSATEPRGLLEGRQSAEGRQRLNVGEGERAASVAAGTVLAALGLGRRNLPGLLLAGVGGALVYRGVTGTCPVYESLEIDTAHDQKGVHVVQAFTIDKPAEQLYRLWRDLENLPQIMTHLKSVSVGEDGRSHWVADAPGLIGGEVAWEAELTEDVPNERIAWRSVGDADVDSVGSVQFDAGPRGTVVRVEMQYLPPAGQVGHWVATLFGKSADQEIREDLRNLKRKLEIGGTPSIKGQPHGSCMGLGRRFSE